MKKLNNKVAIITGAARGIGRGVALEMGLAGAELVLVDINNELLDQSVTLCRSRGYKAESFELDVREKEDHQKLIAFVMKKFGKIDILVNNAGINADGGLLNSNDADVLKVFDTNFLGPYFLTKRVVKEMLDNKTAGNILFTSSTHSSITMMRPAYSSSKAALEMFVRDAALELAEHGIRVNAIAPGSIAIIGETNRTNEHVPIGYSGIPEDIGKAMVFLASDDASYITGQTLVVDGAFSLAHTHYWGKKGKL